MKSKILLFLAVLISTACSDTRTIQNGSVTEYHSTVTTKHDNKMGISIYYEKENIKKPTLYFLSAATTDRKYYGHIFHYLVKQGYVVVGLSTQSFASDYIMNHFYDAIQHARKVCAKKGISDETRIGLVGHSSGAGILPSLGYKLFTQDKLGSNGRFIWGASPWIDFQYEKNMKLPQDTNFVTVLYEDDYSTDPRIYLDIYKLMNVKHKTFIMVKKGGNHQTLFYPTPKKLVYEGVYKLINDLAIYTFRGQNKETIFPKKTLYKKYVEITAENRLPRDALYKDMLAKFVWSRSSFGCKPTENYAPNPREKECFAYKNSD